MDLLFPCILSLQFHTLFTPTSLVIASFMAYGTPLFFLNIFHFTTISVYNNFVIFCWHSITDLWYFTTGYSFHYFQFQFYSKIILSESILYFLLRLCLSSIFYILYSFKFTSSGIWFLLPTFHTNQVNSFQFPLWFYLPIFFPFSI